MNKRFIIGASVVVTVGMAGAFLLYEKLDPDVYRDSPLSEQDILEGRQKYFGDVPEEQTALLEAIDPDEPVRLAIGSLGFADERRGLEVSDLVLARLTGTRGLELVDRQSLNSVLSEIDLSLSGLVRAEDAVRVGQLLEVDWFLLGTIFESGSGTSLLLRIVDAHTGAFRDAEVFSASAPISGLADEVAAFVQRSRANASTASRPVYLAFGTFEDMSVNNRMADFSDELRTSLMASLQNSPVTLLEREAVNTLLQEVRLDLAGLTADEEARQPLQSTYWLIDGRFQSLENQNQEIELVINVRRMFDRSTQLEFRGSRSPSFYDEIKFRINQAMAANQDPLFISRATETKIQLEAGKQLVSGSTPWRNDGTPRIWGRSFYSFREGSRELRNSEEGVRALETVLLLDPGNREARAYLAMALHDQVPGRVEEGRRYIREILEEDIRDRWTGWAQLYLPRSLEGENPDSRIVWFENAIGQTSNPIAVALYKQELDELHKNRTIRTGELEEAQLLAKFKLFDGLEELVDPRSGIQGALSGPMEVFIYDSRLDEAEGALRLAEILPELAGEFPDFLPHFTMAALSLQVSTDNLVLSQAMEQLHWAQENADRLSNPKVFWSGVRNAYFWMREHGMFREAADALTVYIDGNDLSVRQSDEWNSSLADTLIEAEEWGRALEVIEKFQGRPVSVGARHFLEKGMRVFVPRHYENLCREKLGLPPLADSGEFTLERVDLSMNLRSVFAMSGNGIWVAPGDGLHQLNYEMERLRTIELPMSPWTRITSIESNPSKVWIGTAGEGLIEYDQSEASFKVWNESNGLAMNSVSGLKFGRNGLWVGFGEPGSPAGGLAFLDFESGRIDNHIPTISAGNANHESVSKMAVDPSNNVWFFDDSNSLRIFNSDKKFWGFVSDVRNGTAFAVDDEYLYLGIYQGEQYRPEIEELGIRILDLDSESEYRIPALPGINNSSVRALTVEKDKIWVGGLGFVLLLNAENRQLEKIAYMPHRSPTSIQIGGGYVWVQCQSAFYQRDFLYRAPLTDVYPAESN